MSEEPCFFCILTEAYQEAARRHAQRTTSTHGQALIAYRERWKADLRRVMGGSVCRRHKANALLAESTAALLTADQFDHHVMDLHDELTDVYQRWTTGRRPGASLLLQAYLEKHKVLDDPPSAVPFMLFVRARWSESHLVASDLAHIPFDKRFLVGNQRYSLSGYPVLYLSYSTLAVAAELRAADADLAKIWFSSFDLKDPKDQPAVLDCTNIMARSAHVALLVDHEVGGKERRSDVHRLLSDELKREVARSVLAMHCSFARRATSDGQHFVEEYVLPQMVLEWTLEHEVFEGVRFASTRLPDRASMGVDDDYRMNLALVPRDVGGVPYDERLLARFYVSEPVQAINVERRRIGELNAVTSELAASPKGESLSRWYHYLGLGAANWDSIPLRTGVLFGDHSLGNLQRLFAYDSLVRRRSNARATPEHEVGATRS